MVVLKVKKFTFNTCKALRGAVFGVCVNGVNGEIEFLL